MSPGIQGRALEAVGRPTERISASSSSAPRPVPAVEQGRSLPDRIDTRKVRDFSRSAS